jgi:hypothetical protein
MNMYDLLGIFNEQPTMVPVNRICTGAHAEIVCVDAVVGNFVEHVQGVYGGSRGREVGADDEAQIDVDVALLHVHG